MGPIRDVHRYFDVRVEYVFSRDFVAFFVLWARELLGGDDLCRIRIKYEDDEEGYGWNTYSDVEEVFRALPERFLVFEPQSRGFEYVSRSAISLEHGVVDHVPNIYHARKGSSSTLRTE